jgi:AraC-like DNA-binding protein
MPGPSVAAGVTKRLLDVAAELGASRAALLEASGIDPEELGDHDNRIALPKHMALVRAAKSLCGDPAFALHYGDSVNLAEVSVVGLIGYACATVADAFVQLQRYSRLIMDLDLGVDERFQLVPDDEGLWLVDRRPDPNENPELTEGTFAQMMNGMRRFGDTSFVLAVHVTHADPGYKSEYERIFDAPVTFESSRNAMRIDPAWLSRGVAQQPAYVFGVLSRHADELLARLDSDDSARGRVEELISQILHTGHVAMPLIAERMGCSRDTLYRRLKAEGVTFAAVLDEVRHRLALAYVRGGKVSVNETAYLVGFSDPASFSRAFKRWTGMSPRHFAGTQVPAETRSAVGRSA